MAIFFDAGLSNGEAAVAVTTPPHWLAIAERLDRRGHDSARLQGEGLLVVADADDTLSDLSEGGTPAAHRFREVVGRLLDRAAGGSRRRVRAFGEMVDLLCRRDDREAADTLEAYWNELGRERSFALLCGYKLDLFDRDVQVRLLPQVYRTHSEVLPVVEAEALDRAVEGAVIDVLGDEDARKVRWQVGRHGGDARLSEGQRTLMWVSAHMPRAADRILAEARRRYLDVVEAAA